MTFSHEGIQKGPLFTKEQLALEIDKLVQALDEALERLESTPDYKEVTELWENNIERSPEKIIDFLHKNETRLSPEAKFFLNTVIHLRRANKKYNETTEIK